MSNKATKVLKFIKQNLNNDPPNTKIAAYLTIVRPIIEYIPHARAAKKKNCLHTAKTGVLKQHIKISPVKQHTKMSPVSAHALPLKMKVC